jgi:hypothetical protein
MVPSQLASSLGLQPSAADACGPVHTPQLVLVLSDEVLHVWLPALHGPILPVSQLRSVPGGHVQLASLLSGVPSQLLSALDVQSRGLGGTSPLHVVLHVPPVQDWTPALQRPAVVRGPQGWVAPSTQGHSSLGLPSQSASSPTIAHESFAAGAMLHVPHVPETQDCMPSAQFPSAPRHGLVA